MRRTIVAHGVDLYFEFDVNTSLFITPTYRAAN